MHTPRPYQSFGTEKLRSEKYYINADEMGLGKTGQAARALGDRGLVVCPPGLKGGWADELAKWGRTDLTPIVMSGTGLTSFKFPAPGELVIVGYPSLPDWLLPPPATCGFREKDRSAVAELARRQLALERKKFNAFITSKLPEAEQTTLIYDEAQAIKNKDAKRSRKARVLSAMVGQLWVLTGTPMPRGNPFDTYGILHSCRMENLVFKDWPTFLRVAGKDVRKDAPVTPAFHEMLSRYMLRRKLAEVASELPARSYHTQIIDMGREPHDILGAAPDDIMEAVRLARTPEALARISEMPSFMEFSARRRELARARIPAMLEHVEAIEENGDRSMRTLMFSDHREPIEALAGRKDWAVIHGGIRPDDRQSIVNRQNDFFGVGLTIKAGGPGLNLGTFPRGTFLDLNWDYTQNQQALGRNYRADTVDGMPRIYTFFTSDAPLDMLITSKQVAAAQNISLGIDGDRLDSDDAIW